MKKQVRTHAITPSGSSRVAIAILTLFGFGLGGANLASAQVQFDQNVTPDVIFGTGNSNGFFTIVRENGVELGIRAKIPYTGVIHSNGDASYTYSMAETATCISNGGFNCWNFDFTVNTDFDGSSGLKLDDLTYELGMDAHQGLARSYARFDPINVPCADHSIGDNSTINGGGVEVNCGSAGADATYADRLANNNVAQNSWRYAFFSGLPPMDTYDPEESGQYDVYLVASLNGTLIARLDIRVLIEVAPLDKWYPCVGFQPPMNQAWLPPALGGGEIGRKVKRNKVLPFKAQLFDPVTGNAVVDVASPPNFLVFRVTGPPIVAVDVTEEALSPGKRTEGSQFEVISGDTWSYNMATKGLDPGQYYATMDSGDMGEYVITPACRGLFLIEDGS